MALSACLLAACDGSPADPDLDGVRTRTSSSPTTSDGGSGRPATTGAEKSPGRPAVPIVLATRDASRLGRQLASVAAVLREPDAPVGAVRRAAELEQLAAGILARAPEDFRRQALGHLDPRTTRKVRGDVRAAALLLSMGGPQPELPRWRIVRPPPARELLAHYRRAQRRTGVHWTYLAAIHLVETRMGRIRGVSTAGAAGPMQFLPATWERYGGGGTITDPADAILAAGRLLRANGAPERTAEALWHYNPSDAYVGAVLAYARAMQRRPITYSGYWHWRVLYRHVRGTYVLPVGYPEQRPERLPVDRP